MTTYRNFGIGYRETGYPYRGVHTATLPLTVYVISALPISPSAGGIAAALPTLELSISARPLMAVGSPPTLTIAISALPLAVDIDEVLIATTPAVITPTIVAPTVELGEVASTTPTFDIDIVGLPLGADQETSTAPAVITVEPVAPTAAQTVPLAIATHTPTVVAPTVVLGTLTVTAPTVDIDISALQTGFDGAINVAVPPVDISLSALAFDITFIPTVDIDISATPFAAVTNVGGIVDQTEDLPTVTITITAVTFVAGNATDIDAVFECVDTWPANDIIDTCGCHFVVETEPCTRVLTTAR